MIERATVTAPEMIGLLVWWIVMLVAPVILVRRWRRRRKAAKRLRRQVGRPAPEQPGGSPVPPPSAAAISRTRTAPASRPTAPRLSSQALEPLCRYVDFQRRLRGRGVGAQGDALAVARRSVADRALPAHRRAPQHAPGPRRDGRVRDQRHLPTRRLGRRRDRQQARREDPDAASGVLRPGPLGDLPSVQPGDSARVAPRRRPRRVDRRVADRRRLGDRVASALRHRAWLRTG